MALRLPPVERLVAAIVKEALNGTAHAEQPAGNYILMAMGGAPPRWIFDQMLNPGGEAINPSPMAATKYTIGADGRVSGASYQTINYKGAHVSALFGTNVGTPGGGTRPFSDLLDNMIVVRGYGTGADGHPTNLAKQTFPLGTAGSLSGNVADQSTALFKAIQFPNFGGGSGYFSLKGTGLTVPYYSGPSTNYLTQLLKPFGGRGETPSITRVRDRYQDLIASAKTVLAGDMTWHRSEFSSVSTDHEQALAKIKSGISGLTDAWPGLYSKYVSILEYAFKDRATPGYTANPIVPTGDTGTIESPWAVFADQGISIAAPGQDIRDWCNAPEVGGIAATFALCEFVMTQGFCNAYEMSIVQPTNLALSLIRTGDTLFASPQAVKSSLVYDQHGTGIMTGVYLNSCLFRALGGATLELIAQLKAKSMFDRTVIHWTQEFGRLPRNSGAGADHGFDGMISSLITGRHTSGPMVLGNILANGTRGNFPEGYSGCFGYKSATEVNGKPVYMTPAHVASTLSLLLNLPENPWQNVAEPLIAIEGGAVRRAASAKVVSE